MVTGFNWANPHVQIILDTDNNGPGSRNGRRGDRAQHVVLSDDRELAGCGGGEGPAMGARERPALGTEFS
jgi:hypothetical protein